MEGKNKSTILLESLLNYYKNPVNMETFTEILRDKSCMSLRLIDWFVTKYAKNKNIHYIWNDKPFNVYNSYKSQLKAYSKKQMDPFCRRERFPLINNDKEIVTTIGQMNFFKWAIENGILSYIFDNLSEIDNQMKQENKVKSKKKISKNINKRTFSRCRHPVTVRFD